MFDWCSFFSECQYVADFFVVPFNFWIIEMQLDLTSALIGNLQIVWSYKADNGCINDNTRRKYSCKDTSVFSNKINLLQNGICFWSKNILYSFIYSLRCFVKYLCVATIIKKKILILIKIYIKVQERKLRSSCPSRVVYRCPSFPRLLMSLGSRVIDSSGIKS